MSTRFTDSGAGADENPLVTGWSSNGSSADLRRVSNKFAVATGDTDGEAQVDTYVSPNDQWAKLTVDTAGAAVDGGPCTRMSSDRNLIFYTNYNANDHFLFKRVEGGYTQLDSLVGVAGNGDELYIESVGDNHVVKRNNVEILSATDSSLDSGQPGIFIFKGDVRFTNFESGDFEEDGGTVTTKDALSNLITVDTLLASMLRNRNAEELTLVVDNNSERMLRGVIATDPVAIADETLLRLIFTVLAGDSSVVTDEIISSAGRIIESILSSSTVVGDRIIAVMERGVVTTDLTSLTIAVLSQLSMTRETDSIIEVQSDSFNFKLLTRTIQDSLIISDVLNALFISGTVGQFDGSKVKIGYQRKPIVISGYHLEV